jgi:hypothetical protein
MRIRQSVVGFALNDCVGCCSVRKASLDPLGLYVPLDSSLLIPNCIHVHALQNTMRLIHFPPELTLEEAE